MQSLEVSGAVRPIYESLDVKRLIDNNYLINYELEEKVLIYQQIETCFAFYGIR